MGLEDSDRLAGLHQQSFIIFKRFQRGYDRVISLPAARRASRSAIHDQISWALAYFFVKVVHQHAHRCLLLPTFARKSCAARRTNWRVGGSGYFGFNRHE